MGKTTQPESIPTSLAIAVCDAHDRLSSLNATANLLYAAAEHGDEIGHEELCVLARTINSETAFIRGILEGSGLVQDRETRQ